MTRTAYDHARNVGQLVLSAETYREFSDVLVRSKFDKYTTLDKRHQIIRDIGTTLTVLSHVTESIRACRDPKDDKFLSLAVSISASCSVTGDQDLLILHPFQNIPILTPADFLKQTL